MSKDLPGKQASNFNDLNEMVEKRTRDVKSVGGLLPELAGVVWESLIAEFKSKAEERRELSAHIVKYAFRREDHKSDVAYADNNNLA